MDDKSPPPNHYHIILSYIADKHCEQEEMVGDTIVTAVLLLLDIFSKEISTF